MNSATDTSFFRYNQSGADDDYQVSHVPYSHAAQEFGTWLGIDSTEIIALLVGAMLLRLDVRPIRISGDKHQ